MALPRWTQRGLICIFFTLVCIFSAIVCFISDVNVVMFGVAGGTIGVVCSIMVLAKLKVLSINNDAGNSILFWRTMCDLGVGGRLMLGHWFNIWQCGQYVCPTTDSHCSLPSGILEFFVLSSECWFLCVALDLAISVTDPFASQKARLRWYHVFCWSVAVVAGMIVGFDRDINGAWYITENVNGDNGGGICWIETHVLGGPHVVIDFKPWAMYLLPMMIIYVVPLRSLLSAYRKVRMGLSKTFEHRGRMFLSSAINVVVYYMYLLVIFVLYMSSTWFAFPAPYVARAAFKLLVFCLAARGYVNMIVFYLVDANQLEHEADQKTIDVNTALKEELLYFATIGITECARRSANCRSNRVKFMLSLFENAEDEGRRKSAAVGEAANDNFSISHFLNAIFGSDLSRVSLMIYRDPSLKSITTVEVPEDAASLQSHAPSRHSRDSDRSRDGTHMSGMASGRASGLHRDEEQGVALEPMDCRVKNHSVDSTGGSSVESGVSSVLSGASSAPSSHGSHMFVPSVTMNAMHKDTPQAAAGIEIRVTELSSRESSGVDRGSDFALSTGKAYVNYPVLSSIYRTMFCIDSKPTEGAFSVQFSEFKPYYFRQIRISAGISDDAFIDAFRHTVKERLTEGGASGAFFFYSQGEKFVAKSLKRTDIDNLLGCVEAYTTHLLNNKKSLITKIYGAYNLHIYGNDLTFVVMSNVLLTRGELISERYDIKGSWVNRNADVPRDGQLVSCRYCNKAYTFRRQQLHGRKASQGSSQSASLGWLSESGSLSASSADNKCPYTVFGMHKPNVTLKDNDLKSRMLLSPVESRTLLDQLRKDAEFLYQHDFMDYSLLIGVHNTEYQVELPRGAYPQPGDQKLPRSSTVTPARDSCRPSVFTGSVAPGSDGGDGEDDPLLSLVSPRYQATRVVGAESYYFGIIDFQQKWDYSKTAERWAKMLFEPDRNGISAVEPGFYRDRFIRTLEELFVHHEEDSESQA